jgi:hypothetical protein
MPLATMVDIETLSTHETNAVVLSIGAVRFSLADKPIIHSVGSWVLQLHPQFAAGREVLQSTVDWWAHPDRAEARKHWAEAKNIFSIPKALDELSEYIGAMPVWANGACFDIGNLTSLYTLTGRKVPWAYNAVRDARTIYNACPLYREKPGSWDEVAHHPTEDCLRQIWRLWEHTDKLGI